MLAALTFVREVRRAQQTLYVHSFSFVLVLLIPVCAIRADLLSDFKTEYPAAASRIEQAYSHVMISDLETQYDYEGKLADAEQVEYLRDGDAVRAQTKILQSTDPKLTPGTVRAFGGQADKFFEIRKRNDTRPYAIEYYSPRDDFDLYVRNHCRPVFAPYCLYNNRIVDYLFDFIERGVHLPVRIVSAETSSLDGANVVEVVTEFSVPDQWLKRYHLYFQPHTWTLLGWMFQYDKALDHGGCIQCRIGYEAGSDPPKLTSLQYWGESPSKPGFKANHTIVKITECKFGPIPKSEFSLGAFGVEEPVISGSGTNKWWLVGLNIPIVFAIGIWLVFLAYQRKRRSKGLSGDTAIYQKG